MTSALAIWIDTTQAKIFKFDIAGVDTELVHPHGPKHHVESQGMNHTKAEGDNEKFYHQVADRLQTEGGAKWLVMGSGLARTHFVHHIQKHHPRFAANVIGNVAVDAHRTDAQNQAEARKFFEDAQVIGKDGAKLV